MTPQPQPPTLGDLLDRAIERIDERRVYLGFRRYDSRRILMDEVKRDNPRWRRYDAADAAPLTKPRLLQTGGVTAWAAQRAKKRERQIQRRDAYLNETRL